MKGGDNYEEVFEAHILNICNGSHRHNFIYVGSFITRSKENKKEEKIMFKQLLGIGAVISGSVYVTGLLVSAAKDKQIVEMQQLLSNTSAEDEVSDLKHELNIAQKEIKALKKVLDMKTKSDMETALKSKENTV